MEPITDVRQISRIAYGYMASQALFQGLELDLFTRLSQGSKTLEQMAAETQIAPNRLQSLVTSLVSLGLMVRDGESYSNAPASESYLVSGAPGDYGDYLKVVNGRMMYSALGKLGEGMRGVRAFSDKGFYDGIFYQNQIDASNFTAAQHKGSLGPATLLARRIGLAGYRKLLDVGGGSGAFTIALCKKNPGLEATILDFPETMETARNYAKAAGLAERIGHSAGNALTTPWPNGQDAVLMSYLWSAVGGNDIKVLAAKAFDAIRPGGMVMVHDFMTLDDCSGPPIAAWHLLVATIDNPEAVCLTPRFVTEQLTQSGFTNPETSELLPGISSLTIARKPA